MKYTVDTGLFVKTLNAALSYNKDEEIKFGFFTGCLAIYGSNFYFLVGCTVSDAVLAPTFEWSVPANQLKPVSTLKASVVEEEMSLSFRQGSLKINSGVSFILPTDLEVRETALAFEAPESIEYAPPAHVKMLSKYLAKLKKDNFKGCIVLREFGILLPGTYQLSCISMPSSFNDDIPYLITSTQLNKLLKLGQDICILPNGKIYSDENVLFCVQLPKAPKEAFFANEFLELEQKFSDDLPVLEIKEPKIFKDFLKNTKSDDKQYDLCSVQTEPSRIVLSFYTDKSRSNKFIYTNVVCPENSIEVFVQTKHLLAFAEIATENIKIQFSSNFEPLRVCVDDTYVTYLMQGVVV